MVTPMWEHEIRVEAALRSERVRDAMAPRAPRPAAGHWWSRLRGRAAGPTSVAPVATALPTRAGTADVATDALGLRPA